MCVLQGFSESGISGNALAILEIPGFPQLFNHMEKMNITKN